MKNRSMIKRVVSYYSGSILAKLVWTVIIVIILVSLGKTFLVKPPKPIVWSEIDESIVDALGLSRDTAKKLASSKLDVWVDEQMTRVDNDFLKWYFSYWNQQKMGLESLWHDAYHWVDSDKPTASEIITEKIQEEFSKRVLKPKFAQLALEKIANEVMERYADSLRSNLQIIPGKYNIPQQDWNRHLHGMAILIANGKVEASLNVFNTRTTAETIRAIGSVTKSIRIKVPVNLESTRVTKMVTKTGGKVAARAGGKFLGPIIGIGILIWEVWDYNDTVNKHKPILRKEIQNYFYEIRNVLLHDTDSGIMTMIYKIENNVRNKI